jgi:DNA-binding response OmpR family regulator
MARVAVLCPDLLFGSKVEGALTAAGHEVTRLDTEDAARAEASRSELLVVDLTAEDFDGAVLVESMKMGRELEGVSTLGFYSHVDQETRRRAVEAGFDLVVPRSRMAREGATLAAGLIQA